MKCSSKVNMKDNNNNKEIVYKMTNCQVLIQYNGESYDVGEFVNNHPGGANSIKAFENKDVTKVMHGDNTAYSKHKHSPSSLYFMRNSYKVQSGSDIGSELIASKVISDVKKTDDFLNYDLEAMVDWTKPMLYQVGNLGSLYKHWVNAPVHKDLILFESSLLEALSRTKWYIVPLIWIPVVFTFFSCGATMIIQQENVMSNSLLLLTLFVFILGFFSWSVFEYTLHRWLFHLNPPGTSKTLITLHFMIHGLHHKVPFDRERLVFPPFATAVLLSVLMLLLSLIMTLPYELVYTAGIMLGYVVYDVTHYHLHNSSPKNGTYLHRMKRYHAYHHFVHHDLGYGISSRFWDTHMGTEIELPRGGYG